MSRLSCFALVLFICSTAAGTTGAWAADWVIHAGTLLDGISATPRQHVSILGHDDKILAVEAGFAAPEGVEIIDLSVSSTATSTSPRSCRAAAMRPRGG